MSQPSATIRAVHSSETIHVPICCSNPSPQYTEVEQGPSGDLFCASCDTTWATIKVPESDNGLPQEVGYY